MSRLSQIAKSIFLESTKEKGFVKGEDFYTYLEYGLVSVEGKYIFQVKCKKSNRECFLNKKDFYVRTNPATDKLEGRKMLEYIKTRFH